MNTLFNPSDVSGILGRIEKLSPASQRQWGKMNVGQMLAHCNISIETAMGRHIVKPTPFITRFIGRLLKAGALSDKPFGKNSPTDKSYIFKGEPDFDQNRAKLKQSIEQFSQNGHAGCTIHPHPFFDHFTPEEWGIFQWKHLDHHLRQFNV
ncbi:MAG: DUF1569 domain-containing protein [Bacteroidia bacterium]|nr:DUF1569 domain-containing protein [Bacteroidia bacterium]